MNKPRVNDLLDRASLHKKRLYMADVMILQRIARRGFGYSKVIAEQFGYSRRASNYHLRKLEVLGFIERIGRRRCPFQWYRVPRKTEVPVHHVLEYLVELFAENPARAYFLIDFLSATLPCSYASSGALERVDGASVPFGVRRAPGEWLEPVWLPFWIPIECLEEVVWFLDELSITWYASSLD